MNIPLPHVVRVFVHSSRYEPCLAASKDGFKQHTGLSSVCGLHCRRISTAQCQVLANARYLGVIVSRP